MVGAIERRSYSGLALAADKLVHEFPYREFEVIRRLLGNDWDLGGGDYLASSRLQRCNTCSTAQFARIRKYLHLLRHRIANCEASGAAFAGFPIGQIAQLGCLPDPTTGNALIEDEF